MVPVDGSLHRIELISPILVLKLVLDHVENVATCYISCCILLAYDGILAAAEVIALQKPPHVQCLLDDVDRGISGVLN